MKSKEEETAVSLPSMFYLGCFCWGGVEGGCDEWEVEAIGKVAGSGVQSRKSISRISEKRKSPGEAGYCLLPPGSYWSREEALGVMVPSACGQGSGERGRRLQAELAVLASARESPPGSSLFGFEELASILEAWLGGPLLF